MANYSVSVTLNGQDNLTPVLNDANQELNNLEQGSEQAESGLGNIASAATAMATAFVATKALGLASELNGIGDAANDTEQVFTSLSGKLGDVDSVMSALRASTDNVIDDMTLQSEASRILSLHLANNITDLTGIVGLGEKLGPAFGKTATEGIDAFTNALASGRTAGLREIGIDADAVDKRIKDLTQSGMDATQAFRQAAWEEGQKTLKGLGDSALVAEDGMDKLQTRIDNIRQNVGQAVNSELSAAATTVDQIAQIIQIRSGNSDAQVAARESAKNLAQNFTDEYMVAISQYMGQTEFDSGDAAQAWYDGVHDAFTSLVNNPQLENDKNAFMATMISVPESMRSDLADSIAMAVGDWRQSAAITQENSQRNANLEAIGRKEAQKYVTAFANQVSATAGDIWGRLQNVEAGLEDTKAIEAWKAQQQAIADAADELNTFKNSYSDMPAPTDITNVTDTGTFAMMLDDAKKSLEDLQAKAKDGLIPQADVDKAQAMVDGMQKTQSSIEKIQAMTLDGLLGKQGGGVVGELGDKVLNEAKQQGLTDAQIADMQKVFDLQSGRATASSQTIDEQVTPLITEIAKQLGPQAAAAALKNVTAYLQQGDYLHLTDEQLAAGLEGATGYSVNAASKYGTQHGGKGGQGGSDYVSAVAGFDPVAFATSLAETAPDVEQITKNAAEMGDSMATVDANFEGVNTKAKDLQTTMDKITAQVYTVKVNLDISGLDQLGAVMAAAGNGTATNPTHPRNNGGRPGGVDGRAS